jgi:hypothetical protein
MLAFHRLRFLDLHDHVGLGEDLFRRVDDLGSGGDIVGIREARAKPGLGLDHHLMAAAATASRAASGVMPTRNSCGLISFGHPIFMCLSSLGGLVAVRSQSDPIC